MIVTLAVRENEIHTIPGFWGKEIASAPENDVFVSLSFTLRQKTMSVMVEQPGPGFTGAR